MKIMLFVVFSLFSLSALSGQVDRYIERDVKLLHEAVLNIDIAVGEFNNSIVPIIKRVESNKNHILTITESRTIDQFWGRFNDLRISLHTIYNTYRDSHLNDPRVDMIRYSSLVALVHSAGIIVKRVWDNERFMAILDGAAILEIPQGSYMSMQNEVFYQQKDLRRDDIEYLLLFPEYLVDRERSNFSRSKASLRYFRNRSISDVVAITDRFEREFAKIRPFYKSFKNYLKLKYRNVAYKFKKTFYNNFRKISTWIGDTKLKRLDPEFFNGKTLVKLSDVPSLHARLKTGDIMVSRSNWFLSNAFLPGFWPHSFIYLGNVNKLTAFFSGDVATNEFFGKLCSMNKLDCSDFVGFLSKFEGTKAAWKDYHVKDDHHYEKVLIEATSDGVHFSSVHHTFMNDYLGAFRPRLSKLNIARTIMQSFMHFGKEYDFMLDWATDDKIVCSELVSKTYKSEASIGKKGVDFNYDFDNGIYIGMVMGRMALPVVQILNKAYDENVLNVRPSQLDFVLFLKGIESEDRAVYSTEREFYESRNWPKWSFMQE